MVCAAERIKDEDAFNAIARILESPHIDNSKPLRVLFYKDDQPALYDGLNKKRVCFKIYLSLLI